MWIGAPNSWRPVRPAILVVEDELLIRMCAASCLEQAGFDVIEAADGEEARDAFDARGDVALLFTDVDMPGTLDGLGLAHEIRRRRPGLPVIITTGKTTPDEDQMPSGGRFLAKPYVPEALPKIVAQTLTKGEFLTHLDPVPVDAPAGAIYSDK
jgi:CheY-like chemotaxis protein